MDQLRHRKTAYSWLLSIKRVIRYLIISGNRQLSGAATKFISSVQN